MSRWRVKWIPALAAILSAAVWAALAQQAPVIRVDVDLVHVLATVKDPSGALVGTLQKDNFEVYDNGVKQEVAVFERRTEQPLSIALMLDTSGSTGKDLKYETDSASRFLQALFSEGNPADAVALYGVNADVKQFSVFTHNYASLVQRFKLLQPEGATALYDAIYLASSQDLEKREGRKVIVLVTDGDDTYSTWNAHQALEAAQRADAIIYPVVVVPITNDAGRNIGGEHALIFMAQGTGGRTFLPALGPDLDKAFVDIITELRTQYLLGFYPHNAPPSNDRFHTLEVRVNRPELKVSARNGYYGIAGSEAGASDARVSVAPGNASTSTEKSKPRSKK
ncbi:MAG: VWA domain-containing protein [Bryobacteraceae bacterium]|jgi:Ca-activated chloride channel family protein